MAAYSLTNAERETHLLTDAASDCFEISTLDPVFIRKLDRLSEEFPEVYVRGEVTAWNEHSYLMPKRLLRFGKPASEARREANRRNGERLVQTRQLVKQENLQQSP